jgi:hypothetical protein
LALLGIVVFVIISIALEDEIGLPFDTTYRIACASACLVFIWKFISDYPGERWPQISFWIAVIVTLGIFFTPLVNRPTSRGELMLFALPDAIIVLVTRIAFYRVVNENQRAMRMHMIFGLIVAVAFCSILFALTLVEAHTVS